MLLTPRQVALCRDTVTLVESPVQVVNPKAVSRLLVEVYDEWGKESTKAAQHAPPAVLLLELLSDLADMAAYDWQSHDAALKFCKKYGSIVGDYRE